MTSNQHDTAQPISKPIENQDTWQNLQLECILKLSKYALETPFFHTEHSSVEDAQQHMINIILNGKDSMTVETVIGVVRLDSEKMKHVVEKRKDARERYAEFVVPTLTSPLEVWKTAYDDGSHRHAFIGLFDAKRHVVIIVHIDENGHIFWNMMTKNRTKDLNKERRGELVSKKY